MKRPVSLPQIERFLRITGIGPSRFGRSAVNDVNLLPYLRKGGELGPKREPTVAQFMKDHIASVKAQARKLEDLFHER